jgi:hypothetical protein
MKRVADNTHLTFNYNKPRPAKAPFLWTPKSEATGFRAAVCCACGYTRFYTRFHAELLEAHRKGYTSQQLVVNDLLLV